MYNTAYSSSGAMLVASRVSLLLFLNFKVKERRSLEEYYYPWHESCLDSEVSAGVAAAAAAAAAIIQCDIVL